MQLFYVPEIAVNQELPEEESRHCIKVLRLRQGDEIRITDGQGSFYESMIAVISGKKCRVEIKNIQRQPPLWKGNIHIAMAPTKNMDRTEWFAEKATEIGLDQLSFLKYDFSERKVLKTDRVLRILVSVMKQSLKATLPQLNEMVGFREFIAGDLPGQKFIAHCHEGEKFSLHKAYRPGEAAVVLIGPEGDFSKEEVEAAVARGFVPVTLGNLRLRTETTALVACHTLNLINQ